VSNVSNPKSLSDLVGRFGFQAPGNEVDLHDILQQLQGIRFSYVDGGAQSTALSLKTAGGVTGSAAKITTDDVLLGVIDFSANAASGLIDVSLRNDCRIVSTGNVQFSAGATTNSKILVIWWDTSGYVSNA